MADNQKSESGRGSRRYTKEDWIRIALDTLISEGEENVKVLVLSAKLETSRSSFYWHFESRADLLDDLLEYWRSTNTKAIVDSASEPADTITSAIVNVFASWIGKGRFDTRLDFAVRDWARRSGSVRALLDQSDNRRLEALTKMFTGFGYPGEEAEVRARILYFTQIGYDALDHKEDWETRIGRARQYLLCLSGAEPSEHDLQRLDAVRRGPAAAG
ncbi:TetR/AcrR family transcriptional regulator [uncultured Roseobacter sp.]|uniref:TetR/AcrR family transcriptional regulator n=1 Tax=uncultured Roseobacter sp. TaxID=114847 RepID=UPI002603ADCD|nr:TetR/AcrR family transcriptional regulator [uncultured Roseobacter sp.]